VGRSDENQVIGRTAELGTAGDALRRALEGAPTVLVIGGEAGIGRTRVVEAVAADARGLGFLVSTGGCLRMDAGAMPYAAIVEALRGLVRLGEPAMVASSLGGYRREIARLLPEVARLGVVVDGRGTTDPRADGDAHPGTEDVPVGPVAAPPVAAAVPVAAAIPVAAAPVGGPDPLARLRLFEAVTAWLERLAATTPVLLVIEDLHWADPATLDLVRAIAVGLTGRTMLVTTLRTDQPAPPEVQATIAELARDGAIRLELAPLDRLALVQLAADVLGTRADELDPAALDRLEERSSGNPFLARQLIEAGLVNGPDAPYAGVPPSLRDILDARLVALDDETGSVLRAAALQPGPIDDELLADVVQLPIGSVGRALREATEAGVLAAGPGGPGFRHAIQRDVLVEQLGPGERRVLHGRFADALAAGGSDPARVSAIAVHRDAAGDARRSLDAHVRAFMVTEGASAFEAAASHAARAAELRRQIGPEADDGRTTAGRDAGAGGSAATTNTPDAAWLFEQASIAALLAGDPARSAELARRALPLVAGDEERAATLHDRVRWALWEAGDREGARHELDAALEGLGDRPTDNLRARLTAQQAAMHMDDVDPARALELAGTAIRTARRLRATDIEAIALGVRGRTLAMHGRVDEGLADLRAAVAIADDIRNLQGRLVGMAAIVTVLARCGRARDALTEADAALAVAEASGLGRSLGAQLAAEGARSAFAIGWWDDAARRIGDGLARRPPAVIEAHLRIVALRLAAARGRLEDAASLEARLDVLEPVLAEAEDRAALAVARLETALAQERPEATRPLEDQVLGSVSGSAEPGSSLAWLAALAIRAEVDLALEARARWDDPGEAAAGARAVGIATVAEREALALRASWGARADALLAHVGAERARLDGTPEALAAAWEHAIAAWEAIERPYPAAYARMRLAEARLASGDERHRIAAPLREAVAAFRMLDARPLLNQAERLARLARIARLVASSAGSGGGDAKLTGGAGAAPAEGTDPLATLNLTPRERQVLRLVALGWSNGRIADELGITTKTASVHVSNILAKLDVENRVGAAAIAHRLGIVSRT
jgi:DNA-binding CsgD family transcriptional regulator